MRNLVISLIFSCLSQAAFSALPAKPLPNQMEVYIHQQQAQVVHPNGSTDMSVSMMGDLVTTTGILKNADNSTIIGTYWTQKTTLGMDGPNAVRSNMVYYNITDQTKPNLNGTLYVEGVNETTPGATHAPTTLRPVTGGTGSFAGARGTALAIGQGDAPPVIKVTFTFYK